MTESCHTYEWFLSQIRMSHITHMNKSCHTYERVMSHIRMSHVTHMNESYHTYGWVMSHMWMDCVKHTNGSYHTHKWVMPQIWMSHVAHMYALCRVQRTGMNEVVASMSHVIHTNTLLILQCMFKYLTHSTVNVMRHVTKTSFHDIQIRLWGMWYKSGYEACNLGVLWGISHATHTYEACHTLHIQIRHSCFARAHTLSLSLSLSHTHTHTHTRSSLTR